MTEIDGDDNAATRPCTSTLPSLAFSKSPSVPGINVNFPSFICLFFTKASRSKSSLPKTEEPEPIRGVLRG